jgi:hypothetical protein
MNHLALVTSLKVSGNFAKIAGNFPEFYSDGVVDRVYNVTQLTGYLCFGFAHANVSGDPLSRAHSMQCSSECRTDARKYFFAERIVKIWNSLPAEEANFCNIKVFIYLFIYLKTE